MKVLVEVSTMLDRKATGIGRYTAELVSAMHRLATQSGSDTELAYLYKVSRHKLRQLLPSGRRMLWTQHRVRHALGLQAADCVLWPHTFHPWVAARGLVAVVQDLHALHGINYAADHEHVRQENLGALRQFARHSERLIFSSNYVRQDFLRNFDFDATRAHVVPHGVSAQFFPRPQQEHQRFMAQHGLIRPYLLFAGSPRPSKNLPRMLEAYAASRARDSHDVVVMGKVGEDKDGRELRETIARLGIQEQVRIIGYVPEADLALAFSAADGLLFASFDEGFGLPILEAMAAGTAVLTSNRTSCPEVAAGHAVIAEPDDVDALRDGIEQLLDFSPARLEAAHAYASALNWERSARGTLDVLRLAAADGR